MHPRAHSKTASDPHGPAREPAGSEILPGLTRRRMLVGMLLLLSGCQRTRLASPAPSFEAPRIQPPKPVPLPEVKKAQITQITGDPLVPGVALTPKAATRAWKYIVVHHTATPMGSALRMDKAHRARGWEDGLGYDFIIGNGTETRDGLIEVGPRWTYQKRGAHAGTEEHNEHGIGICLVGNFDVSRPTRAQMDSLARLCAYMMRTYSIPASRIIGHRDCKPTACPGRNMDLNQLRRLAQEYAGR